ncbi:MAG TPA: right-handed parallel beta-helix repeat-containing protein [Terriglobia bacterium]|nr:right-handed parallel beta-helix repeat-containing protein [Terriglobia bacterium]
MLLFLGTIPAFSAQHEVGPGRTYTTIQACVDGAAPGDICNVHGGTYPAGASVSTSNITIQSNSGELVTIDLDNATASCFSILSTTSNVTITGFTCTRWGNSSTVLPAINLNASQGARVQNNILHSGFGPGVYCNGCKNVLIDGNEIFGTRLRTDGGGISSDGVTLIGCGSLNNTYEKGCRITNNSIHDNGTDGIKIQGQYFTITGNNVFNNVTTVANHPDGLQVLELVTGTQHLRVGNNIFKNHTQNIFIVGTTTNKLSDIHVWGNIAYNDPGIVNGLNMDTSGGVNLDISEGSTCAGGVFVYNNFFGRSANRSVDFGGCSDGSAEFKNNIIHDNLGNGFLAPGTSHFTSGKLDYNIYYAPNRSYVILWNGVAYRSLAAFQAAVPNQERNGVAGPANFIQAQAGDFRLASETIGNVRAPGLPLPILYSLDREGNQRGVDGFWDRGAFEFVSPTRPNPPQNLRAVAP